MKGAGVEMWGKWIFKEILPPERLVFISAFSAKDGGLGRHPLAPEWPQQLSTDVRLEDFGGRTLITVRWAPYQATSSEQKMFDQGHGSMTQGPWAPRAHGRIPR